METPPESRCPNCDTPRAGRYCARCGQDNRYPQLRLRSALSDAVSVSIGIEGRLWRTLAGLTVAPGRLVRSYLDGKRTSYVHPLRYMFLTCALWWGVLAYVMAQQDLTHVDPAEVILLKNGNWLNLIILQILTVPIWIVFWGSGRSWLEQSYTMCFAAGHIFLWRAGLSAIGPLVPEGAARWVNQGDQIAALLFTLWTLWGVHWRRTRWLWIRLAATVAIMIFGSTLLIRAAQSLLLAK